MIQENFFQAAAAAATRSRCSRDRCGAVIVLDDVLIATGYNAPPRDDLSNSKCYVVYPDIRLKKVKSDCTCCVHAEWRAIIAAQKTGVDLSRAVLYFARIDISDQIVPSGEPYCTVCSRLALDAGIGFWALLHEDGSKALQGNGVQ